MDVSTEMTVEKKPPVKTNGISIRELKVTDQTGNPAPLGLLAFGMTTVLLNLHNMGLYELGSMILAMGIFYGGIAQIIAGIMEWRKNNTFGTTAFASYGLFWLVLVFLLVLPEMGLVEATSKPALGWFFLIWGLFTAMMYVGTLKLNRMLQWVFATLAILFFLLTIAEWTGSATVVMIAGIEGVVCGLIACYGAIAQVWNELYGKSVLPI